MEYFEVFAVGFFVGVIVVAIYGTRIANAARSDTTALINGVENRLHASLDLFKTSATAAVTKDISKL